MSTQALVSIEQFEQMLRESDADSEFDNGEIISLASPNPGHSVTVLAIASSMYTYVQSRLLGGVVSEIDFRLSEQQVRRPDIAFLSTEKWSALDMNTSPVHGVPDLVVEVASPTDRLLDMEHKVRQYLTCGVQEVWVVIWTERCIYVHREENVRRLKNSDVLATPLLAGFELPLSQVFQAPATNR